MTGKNKAETPWLLRDNKDTNCADCNKKFGVFDKKNICWDCSKTICSKCSVKVRDKKYSLLRRKKFCRSCYDGKDAQPYVTKEDTLPPGSDVQNLEENEATQEQGEVNPSEIITEEEFKTMRRSKTVEPKDIPPEIQQFFVSVGFGPFEMTIVSKRCTYIEAHGGLEQIMSNANASTPAEIENKDPLNEYDSTMLVSSCENGTTERMIRLQDNRELMCNILRLDERCDHAMIRKEVYLMRSQHHPNAVSYLDCLHCDGKLYSIYECPPYCLEELIQSRKGSIDEEFIIYILQQVLLGLESLHYEDRVHRDVNVKNIFIGPSGDVKLGDFGYLYQMRTNPVSALWIAPELMHSPEATTKGDIWNIGTLALFMMEANDPYLGEPLFEALLKQSAAQAPKIHDRRAWSTDILNFIKVCHAGNPVKRPEAHVLLKHHIMDEVTYGTRNNFGEFVRSWKG